MSISMLQYFKMLSLLKWLIWLYGLFHQHRNGLFYPSGVLRTVLSCIPAHCTGVTPPPPPPPRDIMPHGSSCSLAFPVFEDVDSRTRTASEQKPNTNILNPLNHYPKWSRSCESFIPGALSYKLHYGDYASCVPKFPFERKQSYSTRHIVCIADKSEERPYDFTREEKSNMSASCYYWKNGNTQ